MLHNDIKSPIVVKHSTTGDGMLEYDVKHITNKGVWEFHFNIRSDTGQRDIDDLIDSVSQHMDILVKSNVITFLKRARGDLSESSRSSNFGEDADLKDDASKFRWLYHSGLNFIHFVNYTKV